MNIQIKEFDFKTRQNKEDNVNKESTQKVIEPSKEQCQNSGVPSCEQVSFAPDAAWTKRTRVWNSDLNWFNDGYQPSINKNTEYVVSTENVIQKQEGLVADAYAKLLTAKREYLQAKKGLHSLYDNFNVPELKEE